MNETEIKKMIEQIGYEEFYRYYREKEIYILELQDVIRNIDKYIEYKLWNYINERAEYLKCRDELYNIYKDVYKSKYKENKVGE